MYAEPMPVTDWKKQQAAHEKAMQSRLKKLPKNALVEEVLEEKQEQKVREEMWKEWEIVDKLVCEARDMFMDDDKSFKDVTKYLGEAISGLSKTA